MLNSVEGNEVRVTWQLAPTGEDTRLSHSEMEVDIPVGGGPGPSSVVVETGGEVLEWGGGLMECVLGLVGGGCGPRVGVA
ncbi:hypothetical protein DPMN_113105 [Dreissena polymorpha]|uniref:Uncharacterized protein n=1 Tax=Dreissena polymorpha TaxID=45954 RepID=A0A9D4QR99_DREPO|nr:hypothetical protein DPMN_113105 [Dreissena polymorpha]